MEKIERAISNSHPPVRLYLEDLREIASIFMKHEPETFEILCGDYTYRNLDELRENEGSQILKPLEFHFAKAEGGPSHRSLRITVSFDRKTYIYSGYNTELTRSIVFQVEELLKPRYLYDFNFAKRMSGWWAAFWVALIGSVCSMLLAFLFDLAGAELFAVAYIVGLTLGSSFGYMCFMSRKSRIILRKRGEQQSFLARNRDKIMLGVIMLIFGIAGTLLTQWLSRMLGFSE